MSTIQPIITTADLDRLVGYYSAMFGAVELERIPEFYVMLQVGDSELGIVADQAATGPAPKRIALSFAVDSVDRLLEPIAEAGGRVLGPPNDMPWGQRVAHTEDPDGNLVNLTQPVPAVTR